MGVNELLSVTMALFNLLSLAKAALKSLFCCCSHQTGNVFIQSDAEESLL